MIVYITILIVVFILGFILSQLKYNKYKIALGIGLIITLLTLVAGLRYGVGTDFYNYMGIYHTISNKNFLEILISKELGFNLISWICTKIKYEPQLMFFIMSFITVSLNVIAIKKYSIKFELSLFLYITTMTYFIPFNIVRQGVAVAILFYGFKYIDNKQMKEYFITVLIASTFHSSALIMIPIYFLVTCSTKSKYIKLFILVSSIGWCIFDTLWNIMMSILQRVGFDKYVDLYREINDGGVHIIRVLVAAVPVILGYTFYKQLKKKNNKIDLLINFSIINLVLMAMALKATYIARLNLYVEIYNILLIPYFLKVVDRKSIPIIYVSIMLIFFIFMLSQLPTQANLLPYQTIFSK